MNSNKFGEKISSIAKKYIKPREGFDNPQVENYRAASAQELLVILTSIINGVHAQEKNFDKQTFMEMSSSIDSVVFGLTTNNFWNANKDMIFPVFMIAYNAAKDAVHWWALGQSGPAYVACRHAIGELGPIILLAHDGPVAMREFSRDFRNEILGAVMSQ